MYRNLRCASFAPSGRPFAAVAIPARNEADSIDACLTAVARTKHPTTVVVFCNDSDDGTFERAQAGMARLALSGVVLDVQMASGHCHAGAARRGAMDCAAGLLERLNPFGLLVTTDADSRPAPDWVEANAKAIAAGADCVAGAIDLDPADVATLPEVLLARGRLEGEYETLLTELFAQFDPVAHDPWPRHASEPGASLAVKLSVYRAIGGLPLVPFGEDRALVAAVERAGYRVRHDPAVRVITSGRLVGRAAGGVADTIRLRCIDAQAPCDSYLELSATAMRRAVWRRRIRARFAADAVGFYGTWRHMEDGHPMLRRVPLKPCDLPREIEAVNSLLRATRRHAGLTSRADRDGNPASFAAH